VLCESIEYDMRDYESWNWRRRCELVPLAVHAYSIVITHLFIETYIEK